MATVESAMKDGRLTSFRIQSTAKTLTCLIHKFIQQCDSLWYFCITIMFVWFSYIDVPMPPTARGLNTILCLDTSATMKQSGFKKMKETAFSFINGE